MEIKRGELKGVNEEGNEKDSSQQQEKKMKLTAKITTKLSISAHRHIIMNKTQWGRISAPRASRGSTDTDSGPLY